MSNLESHRYWARKRLLILVGSDTFVGFIIELRNPHEGPEQAFEGDVAVHNR